MGEKRQPLVRPWLWVVLGGAIMAAAALGWFLLIGHFREKIAYAQHETDRVTAAREARQQPAIQVAPGPLPGTLPLAGPDGVDADGYPRRNVDPAGLRTLLHFHRYADLTGYLERIQEAFEADPRHELWTTDAAGAFGSAEPELLADFDAWVAATPQSFAPYLARGSHHVGMMWARRGSAYAYKTAAEDFRAMAESGGLAMKDLDRALTIRPHLVTALVLEMRVALATSDHDLQARATDEALKLCPPCLTVRTARMNALEPRWGGSYEAMRAFARKSPPSLNPRFRVLGGFEDLDRASMAKSDKRYADALASVDLAMKHGESWRFHKERGEILRRLERYDEALVSFERADAGRPMTAEILAELAGARYSHKDFVGAARDMLSALRIDPTDDQAKYWLPWVIKGAIYATGELDRAGKHDEALDAADLAIALGPTDHEAQRMHAWTVVGDATTPDKIAAVEARVAANPGDFRAVQQFDYALSINNPGAPFERLTNTWTAYLAVHPEDGRGYMERAGTYHHRGMAAEAQADLRRACDLGINEGCERLTQH
jgi:hypothetical protein